ncbi:MAG: GyrI-like domain-containing protein [Pseudonocardiales bacterium]
MPSDLDVDRDITALYRADVSPQMVDVPDLPFLTIDGHGDPNTSRKYQHAVQALFTLSYSLKFAIKRSGGADHKVGPLEGLWWAADMRVFDLGDKSAWDWTAMIRQPAEVTPDLLRHVIDDVVSKKQLPALDQVRFESFTEGRAAQILHIGPYSAEGPTIARLHAFIAEHGFAFDHADSHRQKHHEIYLGDPRRAAPERLRTIIRQPVISH